MSEQDRHPNTQNHPGLNHDSRMSNLESRISPPRPFAVTLLALLVLSIAGINLIRFTAALADWKFWADTLPISPLYLAVSGLAWALTWTPLTWGLWRGSARAANFTQLAAGAYTLYYWLDRLFLKAGSGSSSLAVAILMTALFLLYVRWTIKRPAGRAFFTR